MQVIRNYRPEPIPEEKQTEVISVAVAVYNSDAFLERAIESILNQTYRNLEVILVDDGSTDRCPEICDRYAKQDPRVRVIHKKNGGLFSSRNVGMEQATGTYLAFVDGDDWLEPEMYEKMLSALKDQEADSSVFTYRPVSCSRIKNSLHRTSSGKVLAHNRHSFRIRKSNVQERKESAEEERRRTICRSLR